ncbi:MAG: hypothetical protein HKO66_01830 [Saprospiraceae bacterium]|nr:hypothetical protein [Bacteroidia bacterium]NNL90950.1 hypothetical protein [Saprospiraceae bacterium]
MKNILLLLLISFSVGINAQVSVKKMSLSLGEQNAFVMDHMDAEKRTVEKIMEEAFKEYGKVRYNRKAKEYNCMECNISQISTSPLSVYFKVVEGKGQVTTYTFFDDGTKFISDEDKGADAIEKFNMNVYYDVQRSVIGEALKDEEKQLKSFNKDLKKLVKKNEDLHEDIEKYKEKIAKAEKEIEKNLGEQSDKKMEISKQEDKIKKTTEKLNNVGRS